MSHSPGEPGQKWFPMNGGRRRSRGVKWSLVHPLSLNTFNLTMKNYFRTQSIIILTLDMRNSVNLGLSVYSKAGVGSGSQFCRAEWQERVFGAMVPRYCGRYPDILICRIGRNFPESGQKGSDITAPPQWVHLHTSGKYGPLQMIQVRDNSVKWCWRAADKCRLYSV